MRVENFEAGTENEGERLDKYLSLLLSESGAQSRSFFQKFIRLLFDLSQLQTDQ